MDVRGSGDGKHAEIAGRDGFYLCNFDGPANNTDGGAKDQEAVSVAYLAGEIGADEESAEGYYVYRNGVHLGLGVGEAKGLENGRLEGDDRGSSIVGAEVGKCSCVLLVSIRGKGWGGGGGWRGDVPKPDFGIQETFFDDEGAVVIRTGFSRVFLKHCQ